MKNKINFRSIQYTTKYNINETVEVQFQYFTDNYSLKYPNYLIKVKQ